MKEEHDLNTIDVFAQSLLESITPPAIFLLSGPLGAGKTTFVRYFGKLLNVKENINSPTFNILNHYNGCLQNGEKITLHHMDCYRLSAKDALQDLDLSCFTDHIFFAFIEWPEKMNYDLTQLGVPVFHVRISYPDTNGSLDNFQIPEKRLYEMAEDIQ